MPVTVTLSWKTGSVVRAVLTLVLLTCHLESRAVDAASFQTWSSFRRQFRLPHMNAIARNNTALLQSTTAPKKFDTRWFDAKLDHFDFTNDATFKLRFLVNKQNFAGKGSPIFLYTGNEGDITWFAAATGLMWEMAPHFGAMLVFVEHRYYGQSLPFGNQSYTDPKRTRFLSSEQAMADFVDVISFIRSGHDSIYSKSPVIVFGGSYGGMLSAWTRMKYPNVIAGALAASAPIWQFPGLTPCDSFARGVTHDFLRADSSGKCQKSIRRSWGEIDKMGKKPDGLSWLTSTFRLCAPLTSTAELKAWLAEAWGDVAMVNYPYAADFLEPLPGRPVRHICQHLHHDWEGEKLMYTLRDAVNVYFNHTGQAPCLNTSQEAEASLGASGWWYQACTEMVMPFCSTGVDDMFEAVPWDYEGFAMGCKAKWGVEPRPRWVEKYYWGKNITTASNIIFSNGDLDPWSGGGVLKSPGAHLWAIVIKGGAHHLDLRASNPKDPKSVIRARNVEKRLITQILASSATTH